MANSLDWGKKTKRRSRARKTENWRRKRRKTACRTESTNSARVWRRTGEEKGEGGGGTVFPYAGLQFSLGKGVCYL